MDIMYKISKQNGLLYSQNLQKIQIRCFAEAAKESLLHDCQVWGGGDHPCLSQTLALSS